MRTRFRAPLAFTLGLILWAACQPAAGERPPLAVHASVYTLQEPDSVRIVIRWAPAAGPGTRQAPVASYETRVRQGAGTVLAIGSVPAGQRVDTLRLATPPLGVTIANLRAEVRTLDTLGQASSWATSAVFGFTIEPLPPNSPDSVTADTSLINQLATVYVRPGRATLVIGDGGRQFCAIGVTWGGATGLLGYEDLSPAARTICEDEYRRWLTERTL